MALRDEMTEQGNFLFKHRSYLPLVIVIVGLIAFVQNELNSNINQGSLFNEIYEICCFLTSLFGLVIRMMAIGYSSDNTSGRNTRVGQVADTLNTSGLYSLCRHPLYVGNFFMWLGIAGFTQNFWFIAAFVFLYWVYYERIMYAEEHFLIDKFGEKYLAWSKKTPAFIPRFKNWTPSVNTYSYAKVIKQEKTGILYLFLVIFIFQLIRFYLTGKEIKTYWIIGLVFGIVWYIIIKIIQKKTGILSDDR